MFELDLIPADGIDAASTPSVPVGTPRGPAAAPAAPVNGFAAMSLAAPLLRALQELGYAEPTEVQRRAIPPAQAGRDLMVSSSTGSGKTASFVLPALQRLLASRPAFVPPSPERGRGARPRRDNAHAGAPRGPWRDAPPTVPVGPAGPSVLVLVPTRELAIQVSKAAINYGRHVPGLRVATVVGGVPYGAQLKMLRGPLDILIATPGRLIDHLQSGKADLSGVKMLVLDEADRMLDMGFIEDIQFIAHCTPAERQTLMYSATFAGHVGRLAGDLLRDAQRIDVDSHTEAHADIEQRLHWADDVGHKNALLDHILTDAAVEQAVVFTSTQRDADWLADRLADMGHAVASLHGGMPQGRRNRVLQGLRHRELRVLVATDVAARGIDVPTISHVINYGLPMKAEDYVHRIGRTGRAGRQGLAVTLAERRDAGMIHRIQRFTTQSIPPAVIGGLEPRRPVPVLPGAHPQRGAARPGAPARPHGGPHGAPRHGEGFKPGGRPKAPFAGAGKAPWAADARRPKPARGR